MKNNFYFTLILVLFFSIANAQSATEVLEANLLSEAKINTNVEFSEQQAPELPNELEFKLNVVRIDSDIKLYFKIEKKVSNIGFVFPEMNLEALT